MPRRVPFVLLWLTTLGLAFLGGAYAYRYRAIERSRRPAPSSPIIRTNLYDVKIEKLPIPGEGRDGSIDVMGDGLLLVNRRGRTWYVTKERKLQALQLQVPINVAEFESDSITARTTDLDRFSVKDVLVQPLASGLRIAASYLFWDSNKKCNAVRVSVLEARLEDVLSGKTGAGSWRTLFTSLCRALNFTDSVTYHVSLGASARLVALSDRQLLMTTGEFSAENTYNEIRPGFEESGRTIVIDVASGASSVFTRGHRNPQGLAIGRDGRIWETEHGARGGDELNLLRRGKDYGAPHVTYGTQYDMLEWPRSKTQGRHEGYEKPVFSWVPSIGISQLVVVRRDMFPWWSGDLLVGSLGVQTLHRVRVENDRTIFVEPIPIGHRIRDIVEMPAGTIAIKTDDDFLIYLDKAGNLSAPGARSSR